MKGKSMKKNQINKGTRETKKSGIKGNTVGRKYGEQKIYSVGRKYRVRVICTCAALAAAFPLTSFAELPAVMAAEEPWYAAGNHVAEKGYVSLGSGGASITVNGNQGQSMEGKRFEIFRLFDAVNAKQGESINYTFNAQYKTALQTVVAQALNRRDGTSLKASAVTEYQVIDYIQSLNTNQVEGAHADQKPEGSYSDFRYFVEQVRTTIKDMGGEGEYVYVGSAKSDNSVTISGLSYGYYIVDEISEYDEDGREWYASSLCMVDTANPATEIEIKSDYPRIVKKGREDDNPDSVGDDGWNDIADYEIGQTVPYRFVSTICDMNGYHSYYYAWHDRMDEALTFNGDKNAIQITISNGKKDYVLTKGEYTVITEGSRLDSGDTFLIEVQDIKAVVDREFDRINSLGHNDYTGLTVTLTYEATLNDLAADRTGRPGFENGVRLEFSNDPDADGKGETGYTPWDTVVCFTFRLNGLKTNDHDLVLEGAKFRLYSDADCRNEVYVKEKNQGGSGYIVINRDSTGGDDHTGGSVPKDAVEISSGQDGVFTIYGLDQGVYYLKETAAPDGYRTLLDPIVITVTPAYTDDRNGYTAGESAGSSILKSLEMTAHIREFYEGEYAEDTVDLNGDAADGSGDLKVINQVGSRLPVTGSAAMPVLIGSGAVLMVTAAVLGRKKNRKE